MGNVLFYKIRKMNNHWTIAFLDNETNEYTVINDDVNALKSFINKKKDSTLIGANNYVYDDILLTSLIKNGDINSEVHDNDITSSLPITLDITQGIVRNYLIDFNNMVCCLWDSDGKALSYDYAIREEDVANQLKRDLLIIKGFYQNKERNAFLNWKMNTIKEYDLGKETYRYSYGNIMREILGLKINDNGKKSNKIELDSRLQKELKEKNDPFLNDLLNKLMIYYSNIDNLEKESIKIGDCVVKFNNQGILGSIESDFIESNTKNDTFLYIDFNSFGPNILINNNWLDKVAKYPEKYSEIKDRRIALKAMKNMEQLYFKYLLNSGLDYLNSVTTRKGINVGLSLTISGIMTMMLLYRNIESLGVKLIECNTDGFIIKCPKKSVENVKNEVKKLEQALSLSCDVDTVRKITHFNTMNYVMSFNDGTEKHLGYFGNFQTNPFYCSGITAVELALREYYLNDIPVSITLRRLRNENNLQAFQIVKKRKSNEKQRFIKENDEYYLYDRSTYRLFAVREETLNNPFFVKNRNGKYEIDKIKRGRSVKDGFYYFELSDKELPDIRDIDLTYYIGECYKVINAHPKKLDVNIMKTLPKRNCFIDIDGTIIKDKDNTKSYMIFYNSTKDFLSEEDIQVAYTLLNEQGGYLHQFLGLCQKNKAYGTIDNFAEFLKSKELFPNKSLSVYKHFVRELLKNDREYSSQLEAYDKSKDLLEYLKSEGYNTNAYSKWFYDVQKAKLESHGFDSYIENLYTIDEYQAKPSLDGWKDVLLSSNISSDDFTIMIGNGTSDLVPKTLKIPSIIVNHGDKPCSKKVLNNGIIVYDFSEIMNPNFYPEIAKIKSLHKF